MAVDPLLLLLLIHCCCSDQEGTGCSGETAYSVAVGVIALLLCIVNRIVPAWTLPIALAQVVWWTPAVIVLTFKGPFLSSGNGYFGTWVAVMSAWHLLSESLGNVDGSPNDSDLDSYSASLEHDEVYRPPSALSQREVPTEHHGGFASA